MVTLLGAFRRERNGLVADTMHYDGTRYGLNYGVSLPTVRRLARSGERDHAFACFLLQQQVRELQLAAFHLADPARLTDRAEALRWRAALVNTELAEEAAFALLSRSEALPTLFEEWIGGGEPLPCYAVLLAAARAPRPSVAWLDPMIGALGGAADRAGRRGARCPPGRNGRDGGGASARDDRRLRRLGGGASLCRRGGVADRVKSCGIDLSRGR